VAVFVGGGVDSSVVLALAQARARAHGGLTVVPVALDCGGPGDDRPYLRALAAHLGLEPVFVAPAAAAPLLRSAMVADAAPYAWPSGPYERALASAAKEHGAEVVLSGVEGDFIFDGDPRDLSRLVREGKLARGVREARALVMPWHVPAASRLRDWLVRPLVAPLVPDALRAARRRRLAHETFPFAGPVLRAFLDERLDDRAVAPRSPSERWTAFATMPRFAEIALTRVQLESDTGLRFREPLMDPEVLRLVARIDPLDLMAGGRLRGLLRESVRGLVPDAVRLRTDKWAHEPAMLGAVEAAGGFAALRDLARATRCRDLGLVDLAAFERQFEGLARAPFEGDWTTTWAVLAVEEFLRFRENGR
jgi:asparagine synthetase B (glutamine-hydrolysing)